MLIIGQGLNIAALAKAARNFKEKFELEKDAVLKIKAARKVVDNVINSDKAVYGINTGFGKFANVSISKDDTALLQKNLILSHACGIGNPLPIDVARAMLILRVNALCIGHSGINLATVNLMLELLNRGITPVIPEKGSLGASGDLIPLAHMCLPLLGLGEVFYKGKRMQSKIALEKEGLAPIELGAKEGLALINGTQAMCSILALALYDAKILIKSADVVSCLTIEALCGIVDAFDERLHKARGQLGQILVAGNLRKLLNGSGLAKKAGDSDDGRVQDAYTLRCIPQIHGASRDALDYIEGIVEREMNAVTDNPLIFVKSGDVISGGNFHGQYLAIAADYLSIAMSEIANVSERRTERLVNPQLSNGLNAFLVKNGGLNSGFMIPQYAAAALVSENKVLSHPASVDSITSSANQEDHVSMGMTAARKAAVIVNNAAEVLGIELMCAGQAAEFRGADKLSKSGAAVYNRLRKDVEFVEEDMYLSPLMERSRELVRSGEVLRAAGKVN
ncbi:MAG: histidine ammonia-lyase [Firmicutes bacterium]|nr:histidine ammonia-lyase [Bacillota bacterium]